MTHDSTNKRSAQQRIYPRGIYARVARELGVSPSLVSRIARNIPGYTSARVTAALKAQRLLSTTPETLQER